MIQRRNEIIHEGKYAAEVPVELIEEEGGWSPYFSFEDAQKLEAVRGRNSDQLTYDFGQAFLAQSHALSKVPFPASIATAAMTAP